MRDAWARRRRSRGTMGRAEQIESITTGGLQDLATAVRHMGAYVDRLRERIRLLEAVVENFPSGLSLFDKNHEMVLCNEQQKKMLDYPAALFENGNPTLEDLFRFNAARGEYGPGNPEEHVARRIALVKKRHAHTYERTRPNGMIVEIRGVPLEGGGFVTTYLDVTQQRRNQAMIAHMAHHDGLTDLPNRTLFTDRLRTAIALAKRGGMMAVHYVDIDNFKPVNDTLGHKGGDEMLVAIADRLREAVRENDTVGRLGGDEFAIVQMSIREQADAAVLARRVMSKFATPFVIGGTEVKIGASIGIALSPHDGVSTDDILAKADAALYRSKAGGKGRFSFFDAE
ncbi:diguanylate cyclase (GGDEF) domain-containing protein [Mesorhizobium albiziae]|uniref:Diguanylate cyclase (GGDEF) domain-containing protein n=1 Tax=Neomesorhizobium albiziae TaxID=335020 RepID=A0A1I3WRI4_9HYPH|nr:diguanylate cyclase [Mesorhizobium albiziae]SFK09061.1 diguanylate cyclase (GGDEF) domain-containing protein [Mesorhizobium albiziae]